MPTINILKDALFEAIGVSYTDEEFGELCFDFGIELDEITSEKQIFVREKKEQSDDASDAVVYKIEVPANRYDLLCMEGLVRGLKVFLRRMVAPQYSVIKVTGSTQKLIIKSETAQVRPFALAAVLRNITFTEASYNSFIDLQDKLHLTVGRKRTLVAIGTHDLDTVEGPFTYEALPPHQIKFKALNQAKEHTGLELMELYSHDSHLKEYLHIIRGKSVYPVIFDRNKVVLSMPPIINGDHSRLSLNTKNVLIDITATDLTKAKIVLDTLVTMFSQYCDQQFTCECVEIEKPDGKVEIQPQLKYREQVVSLQMINQKIGISEPPENIQMFLSHMGFESNLVDESVKVMIPPTRADILHPCDIIEDVAIAFGFNNVHKTFPKTCTVGHQLPVNKLSDQIRLEVALLGFTEALTFALCSCDDISSRLRKEMKETSAVQIANPKTSEFQVARTSLLPGLLKTIAANKRMPIPLRIFEVADVVLKNNHTDVGAKNQRRLCAVHYNKTPGFEIIHGLLDRVMQVLNVANNKDFYCIKATEDSTYFSGWCAEVYVSGKAIGKLGVIHPEVITAFDLSMPASVVEINIEQFV